MAKISLVVTGGVRAAKQWDLTTRLQDDGHCVRCITTRSALLFLIAHYLKHPGRIFRFLKVWHSPFGELGGYFFHRARGVAHINAAKWGDVVIMAPATCNSLSKLVSGITDNFALLTVRAAGRDKTVIVAPSMNPEMWFDPFIQKNIDRLNQTRKYVVVAPRSGEMRSGDVGVSAMASDESIVQEVYRVLNLAPGSKQAVGRQDSNALEPSGGRQPAKADKVLIVDPDVSLFSKLFSISRTEFRQLELISIEGAASALTDALRLDPSVIVIDMDAQGNIFADDLLDAWQAHPQLKAVPIIAVGNKKREDSQWDRLATHGIQYIPKPLKPRFLLQAVIGRLTLSRESFQ